MGKGRHQSDLIILLLVPSQDCFSDHRLDNRSHWWTWYWGSRRSWTSARSWMDSLPRNRRTKSHRRRRAGTCLLRSGWCCCSPWTRSSLAQRQLSGFPGPTGSSNRPRSSSSQGGCYWSSRKLLPLELSEHLIFRKWALRCSWLPCSICLQWRPELTLAGRRRRVSEFRYRFLVLLWQEFQKGRSSAFPPLLSPSLPLLTPPFWLLLW